MRKVPAEEIIQALKADPRFQFKDRGEFLSGGVCPQCGKRELFIPKAKPWYLTCNRRNNCGYESTVRDELPDLFENYADKYPPTKDEPDRTANVYLSMDRGFDLSKIQGWYTQEATRTAKNEYCPSVRFYLDEGRTRFWERLIGRTKGDGNGKKAHIGGTRKPDGSVFKGDVWTPPGMELEEGEQCFLVEGIFHAIALHHEGLKAAAAISCNNFPTNFIEAHKGKKVRWTLALDGDKAGRKYMKRHAAKLKAMGEAVEVCLLPDNGMDWDDLFRAGRITEKFMDDRLYYGRLFMAETVNDKAYYHYMRNRLGEFTLDFDNAMYSVEIDTTSLNADLEGITRKKKKEDQQEEDNGIRLESAEGRRIFMTHCDVKSISNCILKFLYVERDELLNKQSYMFKISYQSGAPSHLLSLEGSNIDNPAAMKRALFDHACGANFSVTPPQLKYLHDTWFNRRVKLVSSVPFIGYEKENKAYIFQKHAVCSGRVIPLNEQGHFEIGKRGIKSNLGGLSINTEGKFSPAWLPNYVTAFGMPGLALMAFWFGSLFVQQIRAKQKSYPFFEFTGEPGAGKSTCLEFLWKCVGRDTWEGFDVMKATKAGRRREFAQVSNLPVVIIEADRENGEGGNKIKQFNFDECKPFFNGRGTGTLGIAKRGNDTEDNVFQASLIISQNAEVDGSEALLQRIVHCHVDKSHHTLETRGVARWFERQTPETVGGFLMAALKNEKRILEVYEKAFARIENRFSSSSSKLKNGRIVMNHAQVAACGEALSVIFPAMDKRLREQLTGYLYERALAREVRLADDHPLVQQFWDLFHYLNEETPSVGEGRLNHSSDDKQIAVSLNEFESYCRKEGLAVPDMKQLKKLLPNSQRHKIVAKSRAVRSPHAQGTKRCWVFVK